MLSIICSLILCLGLLFGTADAQTIIESNRVGGAAASTPTSFSQGGGSCAADVSGNILCTVPASGTFTLTDGTTNWIAVNSSGLVAITSTAGQHGLVVNTADNKYLRVNNGTHEIQMGCQSASASCLFGSTTNRDVSFIANNSIKMRLSTGGLLGLGTTATLGMFHMDKGTGFGQVTLDGSSGGCIMFRDTDDAGWTEVVFLNATIQATTDADGVCDGS